jgi:thiosulfate/3-mercaptopyruvate sulfurtransferase
VAVNKKLNNYTQYKFLMFKYRQILLFATIFFYACTGSNPESNQGIIVSSHWVLQQLEDPDLVILHVGSEDSFDSLHIPRARFFPARDLVEQRDGLRNEIPSIETIDSLLSAYGIGNDSKLVLCYENEGVLPLTARVFLTLYYAGLGNRTHLLNGGLEWWMADSLPVTDSIYPFGEGILDLTAQGDFLIKAGDVERIANDPDYLILDARPVRYYVGTFDTVENKVEGGHIEGARSLPYENLISEEVPGMLKDEAGLMGEFEKTGMDDAKTMVLYCNSGIWGSVNFLVSIHLGYKALFYDGSFEDWENLKYPITRPVIHDLMND